MAWNSHNKSDKPTNGAPPPTPAYEIQEQRKARANEMGVRQFVVQAAIKISDGKSNWKPADVMMLIETLHGYMTRGGVEAIASSQKNAADESRPLPLP
jgi:hypothetical protein